MNGWTSPSGEGIADLKQLLAGDDDGEAVRALVDSLREAAVPLSNALRGTLAQDEYLLTEQQLQALQTGEQVLVTVWEQLHPGRRWMV